MPALRGEQRARQILTRLWYDRAVHPHHDMARVTSTLLLLSGALLLVTWLAAPASSAPPAQATPLVRTIDEVKPVLDDVNEQVDRLKERLAGQVEYPTPTRDPFRFAEPVRSVRPESVPEFVRQLESMMVSAEPAWPRLVAILSSHTDGQPSLRAAFSTSDERIAIVSAGGSVGGFTVADVTSDSIRLTDPVTGQSTRITLQ